MGPGCFHPRNCTLYASEKVFAVGFNGAGMIPSRKYVIEVAAVGSSGPLQWGRDVSIPEIARSPGSGAATSMLQWGRDVSIPEISLEKYTDSEIFRLQWGRDVSIPEIADTNTSPARSGSFNGAAMFPSRK